MLHTHYEHRRTLSTAILCWILFCSVLVRCVESVNGEDDVNVICSQSALDAHGTELCESMCHDRACCFVDGIFNCREDLEDWCLEYSACDILATTSKESEEQTDEEEESEGHHHTPIQEACEPSKLRDPDLVSHCEDMCSTRRCCFADGNNSCYRYDPHWCNEYKVCLNLPDYHGGFIHYAGEDDEENMMIEVNPPHLPSAVEEPPPSNYIVGYLGKFGILAHDSSTKNEATKNGG